MREFDKITKTFNFTSPEMASLAGFGIAFIVQDLKGKMTIQEILDSCESIHSSIDKVEKIADDNIKITCSAWWEKKEVL